MGLWIEIVRVAAGVNTALLLGLTAVWARNYRRFRSKHTLGFCVFGSILLLENATAFYVFLLDPNLSVWFYSKMPSLPGQAMMFLRVLQTAAVAFLAWVTLD